MRLATPTRIVLSGALVLGLSACTDAEPDDAPADAGDTSDDAADSAGPDADTSADASVDSATDAGADAADGSGDATTRPPGGQAPQTAFFVARAFDFEPESADGVARGFDLDGVATGIGDDTGCGQFDFRTPEGEEGVDNQFARLLPLIEAAGGAALPTLVQSAINEGDLLILAEFDGLDSFENDDDVAITIGRAAGDPIVGADNTLLPWQTLSRDLEEPRTRVEGGVLRDGVLLAGPAEVPLPIFVFTFRFDVTLYDALIRVDFNEDGPERVMVGGGVTLENILVIANNPGIQDRIPALIEDVGTLMADLSVDSECDALSVAATLTLSPVHLFAD